MPDDLSPVIQIQSIFSPDGIRESGEALKGLADQTNKLTRPTRELTDAQGGLLAKQEVSRREIKILTAELLRSIGMTEGAGAAGRVAAEGYVAMGDAANYANLAMAGIGFIAIAALPAIISFVKSLANGDDEDAVKGAAAEAAKKLEDIDKSIVDQLPHWDSLARQIKPVPEYLKQLVDSARTLALMDQAKAMEAMADKTEDLTGQLIKARDELNAYLEITPDSQTPKVVALREEVARLEAEIKNLNAQQREGAKAANQHTTVLEMQGAAADRTKKATEDLNKALDREAEYDKAVAEHEMDMLNVFGRSDEAEKQRGKDAVAAGKAILESIDKIKVAKGRQIEQEARDAIRQRKLDWDTAHAHRLAEDERVAASVQAYAVFAGLFTKNKEINIAAALVDTYAAADKALNQYPGPPYTIPFAALAVAEGLANVANIKKAGFDNPASDLMAEHFGTKWASDLLFRIDRGFARALDNMGGGGGGSVSHIQNTTIHRNLNVGQLTVPGFYGPGKTEMLKGLNRDLNEVRGIDKRGRL